MTQSHDMPAMNVLQKNAGGLFDLPQGRLAALVEVIVVALVIGSFQFLGAFLPVDEQTAEELTAIPVEFHVLVNCVLFLFLVVISSWITRTGLAHLGLKDRRVFSNIGLGILAVPPMYVLIVCWVVVFAIVYFLLFPQPSSPTEVIEAKAPMFEMISQVRPGSVLVISIAIGFYEEILFRGFLMGRLGRVFGNIWWAAVISAIVFGALHAATQGWLGFLQTTLVGFMFSLLVIWRRSLWPAIAAHATIDLIGILVLQQVFEELGPISGWS